MSAEEIVVRGQRAASRGDSAEALRDLREFFGTEEGGKFLLGVLSQTRRGLFGFGRAQPITPISRVAVPATMEPIGELRSSIVGVCEAELSERESRLVDGEMLEWAEWDPYRRTLCAGDGVGVVVPEHVTLQQASMALLNCQVAMWPETYLPQQEEEE